MKRKFFGSAAIATGMLIPLLGFVFATPARADDSRFQRAYIIPNTLVYRNSQFSVFADSSFTGGQLAMIGPASKIMWERLSSNRASILTCAYDLATRDKPSRDVFEKQLNDFLGSSRNPVSLYIARAWNLPSPGSGLIILGRTYFYSYPDVPPTSTNEAYSMAREYPKVRFLINSDALAKFNSEADKERWAGVIAHEAAHNFGYDHPGGSDSFVYTFGKCVSSNGSKERANTFNLQDDGSDFVD
jgi:hypothetical protein